MQLTTGEAAAALTSVCPTCGRIADLRGQHVAIQGSAVVVCCSSECLDLAIAGVAAASVTDAEPEPARRRGLHPLASGGALVGLLAVSDALPPPRVIPTTIVTAALSVLRVRDAAVTPVTSAAPAMTGPVHGPRWPPTEAEWVTLISQDAWVHPLNGPLRRMPIRDSRVFGADRPGHRPIECRNGHCGVDIGEVWGEPVMAANEGVVDFVQRGPNRDRGGLFVRLAHRQGTVFTQYFHLAAIPRWITTGRRVRAGEVIGLLGDTGAERSQPHLHFTISVKPAGHLPEQYIDPEPLIALWPVRVPSPDGASVLSLGEAPGRVRGAAGRRSARRKASRRVAAEDAPALDAPAAMPSLAATPESGGAVDVSAP